MQNLFRGPLSLTFRGERFAFLMTLLFSLPAAAAIGFVLREDVHPAQIAVLLVIAMVYVTLARGRLVGSSVRIHEAQYPRVFSITKTCAAALGLPMPMVFVRDDPQVPILTVGLGDPYSVVISSNWIEHFKDDELTFMIGRELGHIASGHTRFTSLLSVNGNENVIVSLIFGAWLRKTELTCDRVGLLCCGSLDAAMRAIVIASFHGFGRKVDPGLFAEQSREIHSDSVLRLGEWLGSMPYATRRIEAMREFFASQLYRAHEQKFVEESPELPVQTAATRGEVVNPRDCAGWWRRCMAFVIDLIVVMAVVQTLAGVSGSGVSADVTTTPSATKHGIAVKGLNPPADAAAASSDEIFRVGGLSIRTGGISMGNSGISWGDFRQQATGAMLPIWMCLYFGLLVGLTGQSAGMMIAGTRVVTVQFGQPRILQSLWRYVIVFFLWWLIIPLSPFSRVYLQDRFSGTRMIKTERVLARAGAAA